MDNYGAIEIGVHRFHHPAAPDEPVGEGRFIHLWQYDASNGSWCVTRVLSLRSPRAEAIPRDRTCQRFACQPQIKRPPD